MPTLTSGISIVNLKGMHVHVDDADHKEQSRPLRLTTERQTLARGYGLSSTVQSRL